MLAHNRSSIYELAEQLKCQCLSREIYRYAAMLNWSSESTQLMGGLISLLQLSAGAQSGSAIQTTCCN